MGLGGVEGGVAVDALVSDEVAEEGELLATLGALEALLPGVYALVHLQIVGGGEMFATVGAAVRPLPGVHHQVPLQPRQLPEALPALR